VKNKHDIKIKIVRSDGGGGDLTKFLDLSRGSYRKIA
jgi:hypothetical protein